ncbi:hypothetical protein CY35_14G031200 [Sphagnum magellanicum]|nr:hypothetical protein CY35_14G031200 [Sphagnum magellanicum]
MPFSSSVQLSSCASSNSLLEFKDGSSSTTPWRRGSSTGSSLLLRVCVHPQFRFTHRKLLQYTSLLPRAHPIEKEAALRDLCKFPAGQREKLWRKFFLDPSQWWDHRSEKTNERYPDFKHKKTREALWLEDQRNPPWVASEIAAMAPGTVQLNIFAWNQKLTKYVKDGQPEKAIQLFQQMQQDGVIPNKFTFVPLINACAGLGALEGGRRVHEQLIQSGCESDVFVGSSLVDMYAKCGSIKDAWSVFNKMPLRNVVTWNAMVLGHVKCGQGQKALELFQQMQQQGVRPNSVTFVGVLNACASMVAYEEGRSVHEQIIQSGCESDVFVGSSLVDMYTKCGSLEDAQRVFNIMPSRDVVTWSAMILGHVKCGQGQNALKLFRQLQQEAWWTCMQNVGALKMLGECSTRCHLEMWPPGMPSLGDVQCMGMEAENMVMAIPCKPQVAAWRALLGTCRIHGNVEMAERVAKQILEMEPDNAAGYVLLSNIYAAAGNRHLCENVERQRMEKGVKKQPGRTWIEVNNEVHTFVVEDRDHPQMIEIHGELQRLSGLMHDAGYVPCTNFILHDVEDEEKVFHLCHHSEKLAIALGLINTAPGTPLRIRKNLRVCEDCHTSIKFISKIVGRAIMVRDANRFHHFEDGICSCMDYW